MIAAEKISYNAAGAEILKSVSLSVSPGEFVGIAGPNGAGKSTILRLLAGQIFPSEGEVRLFGKPLSGFSARQKAAALAFLPAENYAPPGFSAREIVLMGRSAGLEWWRDYKQEDYRSADEALCRLNISHLADRAADSLSSGERQKVFIAQALCQGAKILLLDEPTSHLDLGKQSEIFGLISSICETEGAAAIAASHDVNLLSRYCKKLLLLSRGRTLACGAPGEVVTAENILSLYGVRAEVFSGPPPFVRA